LAASGFTLWLVEGLSIGFPPAHAVSRDIVTIAATAAPDQRAAGRLSAALLAIVEPFIRWSPGFLVIVRSGHLVTLTGGDQADVPERLGPFVQVPTFATCVYSMVRDRVALTTVVDLEGGAIEVVDRVDSRTSRGAHGGWAPKHSVNDHNVLTDDHRGYLDTDTESLYNIGQATTGHPEAMTRHEPREMTWYEKTVLEQMQGQL
jgi:hypothetical protein